MISDNRRNGVRISGDRAEQNKVQGNLIGTNGEGTEPMGNFEHGVAVFSPNNQIISNTISDNGGVGVLLFDPEATGNFVQANFIGTNASGTQALGNGSGVFVGGGASQNIIGGMGTVGNATGGAGNLISGNVGAGVFISSAETTGNFVSLNRIGTDASGTASLGNLGAGVFFMDGASGNTLDRNTIAFNGSGTIHDNFDAGVAIAAGTAQSHSFKLDL